MFRLICVAKKIDKTLSLKVFLNYFFRDSYELHVGGKFIDAIKDVKDIRQHDNSQRKKFKRDTETVLYGGGQDLDVLLSTLESFSGYERKRKATYFDTWDEAKKRKLSFEGRKKNWQKFNFDVQGLLRCVQEIKDSGEKVRIARFHGICFGKQLY